MLEEEIIDRFNKGETPAGLAVKTWEEKLKVIEDNKITNFIQFGVFCEENKIEWDCPLCTIYEECKYCPLTFVDKNRSCNCEYSVYSKMAEAKGDEFIPAVKNLIGALKAADVKDRQRAKAINKKYSSVAQIQKEFENSAHLIERF